MEKIITIQLAGQILPIEETAYNHLTAYFNGLRSYFQTQEGGAEILSDIETRVAELFAEKLRLGAPAINAVHVAEVEAQMGSVDDFREADGEAATGPEASRKHSANTQSSTRPRRRFFRSINDKVVGGVCAGLAGYFNVDPALVRIIFGVLALAGWGTGILLYVALWFLVPESDENAFRGQRLYRSEGDRWIGGVCGGMAAYFDKDPWLFRLVFAIPLLFGTGFWGNFSFVLGSLSGSAVLIYILLWMVLPVAKTDFQKMESRGEKIDIQSIRDNVYSDLKNRSQSFAQEAREAANRLSQEATARFSPQARGATSTLGRMVRAVFLFFAIAIGFFLFALLMGYFFGGFSKMANLYLFETPRQQTLAFLTVILLLGMPILSILTLVLRSTIPMPAGIRYVRMAFNILWLGGFATLAALVMSLGDHMNRGARVRQAIPVSVADSGTLVVRTVGEPIQYRNTLSGIRGSFRGLDLDRDSLRSAWVTLRVVPAPDSQYHAVVTRSSLGETSGEASRRAQHIIYPVETGGGLLNVLSLPAGFTVAQPDYYRGQQVAVEIQVPTGRTVRFDPSLEETLFDGSVTETDFGWNKRRKRWRLRRSWRPSLQPEVTYVMGTDGRLQRADGLPEGSASEAEEPIESGEETYEVL